MNFGAQDSVYIGQNNDLFCIFANYQSKAGQTFHFAKSCRLERQQIVVFLDEQPGTPQDIVLAHSSFLGMLLGDEAKIFYDVVPMLEEMATPFVGLILQCAEMNFPGLRAELLEALPDRFAKEIAGGSDA